MSADKTINKNRLMRVTKYEMSGRISWSAIPV